MADRETTIDCSGPDASELLRVVITPTLDARGLDYRYDISRGPGQPQTTIYVSMPSLTTYVQRQQAVQK